MTTQQHASGEIVMSILATIGIVILVILGGSVLIAAIGAILAIISGAWSH